jgi:hypothetical protein
MSELMLPLLPKMRKLQRFPDVPVAVLCEWIQIHSHRSGEQDRILWDDRQARSKLAETLKERERVLNF